MYFFKGINKTSANASNTGHGKKNTWAVTGDANTRSDRREDNDEFVDVYSLNQFITRRMS